MCVCSARSLELLGGVSKLEELFDAVQKAASDENCQDLLQRMRDCLGSAEADLHFQAELLKRDHQLSQDIEGHPTIPPAQDPDFLGLPERTATQADNIEEAYKLFVRICQYICKKIGYSRVTTLSQEIELAMDNFEKSFSGPVGDDDDTYQAYQALTNQLNSIIGRLQQVQHILQPTSPQYQWPQHRKRRIVSGRLLQVKGKLTATVQAAAAFDTERSNNKLA